MKAGETVARKLARLSSSIKVEPGSITAGRVIDLSISALGSAVLGSTMAIPAALAQYVRDMQAKPQSGAIGFSFSTSAELAAMLNCVACHATEYEDVSWPEGQYTCCLIPAMFSLGEFLHSSGHQVIESIVSGFEVAARPLKELEHQLSQRGFLGSAVFGTIGTAAGAARLMGLDEDAVCRAITLAASMSGGLLRQTGSAAHVLEAGFAARDGMLAAALAAKGLGGSETIMNGERGYFDAFVGASEFTLDTGSPANPRILSVGQKKYPCAYPLQRVIDAFAEAVVSEDLLAEDIDEVRIHVNAIFPRLIKFSAPGDGEEARLSLEHVLASFLRRRSVDFRSFTQEAVEDGTIIGLRDKFKAVCHEDWGNDVIGERNVVEIVLNSGRRISIERKIARGDAEDPLSREETLGKFRHLTDEVLGAELRRHVVEVLEELPTLDDVAPLMQVLTSGVVRAACPDMRVP